MKTLIRSNKCSINGIFGYMPRISNGSSEECERFQKGLRNILDVYGIRYSVVSGMTVIPEYRQDDVEYILFYVYKNRYKIDLS